MTKLLQYFTENGKNSIKLIKYYVKILKIMSKILQYFTENS
jgi:hypothetical protein